MITLRELRKLARAVGWDVSEPGIWSCVDVPGWEGMVDLCCNDPAIITSPTPFAYDPSIEIWGRGATKAAAKAEARANAGIFLEAVGRMTYGGKAVRDE